MVPLFSSNIFRNRREREKKDVDDIGDTKVTMFSGCLRQPSKNAAVKQRVLLPVLIAAVTIEHAKKRQAMQVGIVIKYDGNCKAQS